MADVKSTLTHNGVMYLATIVTIDRTELGREDHGIFTASLAVSWGGSGTSIGGYALDDKPEKWENIKSRRPGTAKGMQFVIDAIWTVVGEYGKWEDLKGKRVFMLHDIDTTSGALHGMYCRGIASLDGQRVMIFADVFSKD